MKLIVNTIMVLILSALFMAGCSSTPEPKKDPYNDADSQRTRSDKAQGELSSETIRK
ncbi:MAG: hypothetical protein LJE83_14640 [Gammaproteobacteria bacterium]|jgi:PBP1b-binding outer membrane lipoprotein LpoB|nr:hypothetical protein [Gammaproteobacteria bacterium]